MNQIKQNIMVVSILFLSLLTTVALSYAITPINDKPVAIKPVKEAIIQAEQQPAKTKLTLSILLPRLVK